MFSVMERAFGAHEALMASCVAISSIRNAPSGLRAVNQTDLGS